MSRSSARVMAASRKCLIEGRALVFSASRHSRQWPVKTGGLSNDDSQDDGRGSPERRDRESEVIQHHRRLW